jgi:peptide/nickel transport system substrate-binding protein
VKRRLLALLLAASCARPPAERDPRVLVISAVEQQAAWTRNFNPLMPGSRWPSAAGIHEPLAIFNSVTGEWVPWLATGFAFSEDHRRLTFAVRSGVRWSDGAPFSASDVRFTFELLRRAPPLDQGGLWRELEGVVSTSSTVELTFRRPFAPGLQLAAHVPIVPAHVWEKVADPVTFTNAEPVGTGPFTEVQRFGRQVYQLGRNPYYWQPGRPEVEAIQLPALPGNEQANLALVNGELDWAANFVPAVQRVFVERDPAHHRYWFPPLGGTVFLYLNTRRPPLDRAEVRRAFSRALDRQRLVEVAMYGYTRPADATGLGDVHRRWRDPALAGDDWVRLDRARAAAELSLPRDGEGRALGPDGRPLVLELLVVSGWSDWIRAAQVIARDLSALGVKVEVRLRDQGAWFERLQKGDFDLAIGWSYDGSSPYDFYRWLLSSSTVVPVGEPAAGNWHRLGDPEADRLLARLEAEGDPAELTRLYAALQARFVALAPAIPLFTNPSWGEFNTRYFEGFPDEHDPYAALSPNKVPECLLALTRIRPRAR